PADNGTSAAAFVEVTGTVNENSTVVVTDNAGAQHTASITGSTFTATVNLVNGVNTLTVTATDLAGNTSSAKRTISYEGPVMTVAVTSPNQDVTTSKKKLVVTGTVTDAASKVTVTIAMDGRTFKTKPNKNGVFKKTLKFKEAGQYSIAVTATDAAGNSSSASRNVIFAPAVKGDDDDDEEGGGVATHVFGWTNPRSSHQSYVENRGVSSCLSCHSIDPASKGQAMSCYRCHGQKWDAPAAGGTTGGGTTATHPFGWTNPEGSHPSYVEKNGTSACLSCHTTSTGSKGQAMSCYNCHGKEW
ncbi:MAG TPA: Ig-like domain-containing protein, partial [Verrucomicrobiae bacterium]|nr:Ig-like domain-containing protein [Verrucomicrobiae bacterium]